MPAVPSCLLEPLREQFLALLPDRHIEHPLSCHRPRIDDRIVFDKLAEVLVDGAGYEQRVADSTCSATTLRRRHDEWIRLGIWLAVLLTVAVALLIVGSPSVAGATQHQNAYMYTYWNWSPAGSFGQNLDQEHPRPGTGR